MSRDDVRRISSKDVQGRLSTTLFRSQIMTHILLPYHYSDQLGCPLSLSSHRVVESQHASTFKE